MAKATAKREAAQKEATDKTTESFVEAGFTVDRVGITTIYHRRVSNDVREASRAIAGGRVISCPPKKGAK